MFNKCEKLVTLKVSNAFKTSNADDMSFMFSGCSSLMELNLETFTTEGVTTMESMFDSCTNLQLLDLSKFDTGNCQNFDNMFNNANKNMTVIVSQTTGKKMGEAIAKDVIVVYQ